MINSWFSLFLDSGTQGLEALQGNTGPQRPAQNFDFQRILDTYRDESEVAVPTPLAGGEGTTSAQLPPMVGAGHSDGQLWELIRSFSAANAQKPTVPLATPSPETIAAILTGLTKDRYTIPLPGVTLQDLLQQVGASTEIKKTSKFPETGEPATGDSPHVVLLAFDRQALTGFLSSSTLPRERVDIPVILTVQPATPALDEAPVPEISGRLTLMPEGQRAFRKILTSGGITGNVTAALESEPSSAATTLHPETTTVSLDAVSSVVVPVSPSGKDEPFELIVPAQALTPESGRNRVLVHAHTAGHVPEPVALESDDPDTLDALMQRIANHLTVRSSGDRAGISSKEILPGDPFAGAAADSEASAASVIRFPAAPVDDVSVDAENVQHLPVMMGKRWLDPGMDTAGDTPAAVFNSRNDIRLTLPEMPSSAHEFRFSAVSAADVPVVAQDEKHVPVTVTGHWRLPELDVTGETDTTDSESGADVRQSMLIVPVTVSGLQFDKSSAVPEQPALALEIPVDELDLFLSDAPAPVAGHLVLKPSTDQPESLTGTITMESISVPLLRFLESSIVQDAPVIPVIIQRTDNPADSLIPADRSVINNIAVTVTFSLSAPVQPPAGTVSQTAPAPAAEIPVYHIIECQDGSFAVQLPDGSPAILSARNAYAVLSQPMNAQTDAPAAPAVLPVAHVLEALQELQTSADQQISLTATTTDPGTDPGAGVPSVSLAMPVILKPEIQPSGQEPSGLTDKISVFMEPVPSRAPVVPMDSMDVMDALQVDHTLDAGAGTGQPETQDAAGTVPQQTPAPAEMLIPGISTAAPDRPAPGHVESAQQTGSPWLAGARALRVEAPPAHHVEQQPQSAVQPHDGTEQPDAADGVKTEQPVPALFEVTEEGDQEGQAPRTPVKAAKTSVVITYRPVRSLQTQTFRATFTTDAPAQQTPAQSPEPRTRVYDGSETPLSLQQGTPVPHAPAAESALTATGDAVTVQLDAFSGHAQTSMGQRQDGQMPASGAAAPDGTFAERLRVSDALIEQNVQRITHHARLMLEDGRSEIRMRLDPPQLGRLSLRMTLENGQIHGRILVERHEAQRLLQEAIPALRQNLHAQGVDVQSMDVQLRDHGSASDPSGRFLQPDAQRDDSQTEWDRHRQEDTPEWKQFRKRRDGYRGQKFEQFA